MRRFVEACRRTRTILPATTTIERLCADALVDAERRIEARIAERVPPGLRRDLEHLLEETADAGVTRFVWLRQFEPSGNSADANRLLDRLDHLGRLDVPEGLFHEIPPHRITRLRRQGERYFADGLRELPDNRRLAILAVCAVEWELFLADAVVETHDRLVGRTYREATRACEAQLGDETAAVREALRAFAELGTALLGARDTGEALDAVVADGPGWEGLGDLVAKAAALASSAASDPLNHVLGGYSRFRRYTPRMLRTLDIEASPAAEPLLEAVGVLRSDGTARPTGFLRPNSRWSRLLRTQSDHRLWETPVLFHLRDAFRAGDVWLARSRRYGDIRKALLSAPAGADADRSLPVPASPHDWLAERRSALDEGLRRLAAAARAGAIAGGSIEDSVLRVETTETAVPDGAADLVADLYRRMPEARITDILLEVDDATRFTEAFTHLRTGEPCRDRIGLLNVLLAEGINLGLRKMAEATNTHGFWELMRIARWHVEGDAFDRALAVVVEAQAALPMAAFWGTGRTASSDGQFFPAGGRGEALNLVNARYGAEPGVKAYSHVSDRFSPFATQTIPATVHEAPYILDGLLMNETGRRVREQYADTGGFTDHVFAACSILGYAFVPRIDGRSLCSIFCTRSRTHAKSRFTRPGGAGGSGRSAAMATARARSDSVRVSRLAGRPVSVNSPKPSPARRLATAGASGNTCSASRTTRCSQVAACRRSNRCSATSSARSMSVGIPVRDHDGLRRSRAATSAASPPGAANSSLRRETRLCSASAGARASSRSAVVNRPPRLRSSRRNGASAASSDSTPRSRPRPVSSDSAASRAASMFAPVVASLPSTFPLRIDGPPGLPGTAPRPRAGGREPFGGLSSPCPASPRHGAVPLRAGRRPPSGAGPPRRLAAAPPPVPRSSLSSA